MGESALLEVEDLRVTLASPEGEIRPIDGIGFRLARGGRLGLVGESGCGKTMTALALMGLLPEGAWPRGRILFDGRDLLASSEAELCTLRGRRIAMVFQEPASALNPVRSIGRQVAEGLMWHLRLSRREAAARAQALLTRVGLPPERVSPQLYPHQLSGGMRQRVVLAMALACEPDLLIADEPTTALDVTIQAEILDLLALVVAEAGMGLMMISHDLGVVAETTDAICVMYAGRIVETGPTAEVFAAPAHPYTRLLLEARPQDPDLPPALGRRLATIPGVVPEPGSRPSGCRFRPRCPRASALCEDEPPWVAIGRDRQVACFHPHEGQGTS